MTVIVNRKTFHLRGSHLLAVFGLAALFLSLRWNNYDAPLNRDEGEYAYASQLLVQGVAPYQHAFIQKPPAIFYTYALSNLLLPHTFWGARIVAALFVGLATILLGFIARREFGSGFALPAMWLATPMILLPGLELVDANVEIFMLLPLVATVAVYCHSRQNRNQARHWFAAGFFAVVTLLFKYTALPVLAFVFIVWLLEMWLQAARTNIIIRGLASAALGGILAFVLMLTFFFIRDGGKTFWECTIAFNRYYAGTNNFSLNYFWSRCVDLWDHWWILFLVPWAILLEPRPRVLFWLGIFICAVMSTDGSCYGHYYAVVMPFWALLCAVGIGTLAARFGGKAGQLAPWATALLTLAVVALILRPDLRWMLCSRAEFAREKMAAYPFFEAQTLADQVARRSTPNDFVYVAGSEPEILYYAGRYSPTRFITTYALMMPTPLAPRYQAEAIRDLQTHAPRLIVFAQTGSGWLRQAATPPEFANFLGRFLVANYNLAGAYVKSDPSKGYWSTNLNLPEFRSASLLLYQRK